MRDLAILACTECKNRNYTTTRNKKTTTERLEKVKSARPAASAPPTKRPSEVLMKIG